MEADSRSNAEANVESATKFAIQLSMIDYQKNNKEVQTSLTPSNTHNSIPICEDNRNNENLTYNNTNILALNPPNRVEVFEIDDGDSEDLPWCHRREKMNYIACFAGVLVLMVAIIALLLILILSYN